MEILIVASHLEFQTGNLSAAEQWAGDLADLGHDVRIASGDDHKSADVLIALHASKSHAAVVGFRDAHPEGKIVVALTGTDLYPELSATSLDSLRAADRIVVLQEKARLRLSPELQKKARVVKLAAPSAVPMKTGNNSNHFLVTVVGHLRQVKDPMRTAEAARLLPPQSRIEVRHAGGILEDEYTAAVERERTENPRYRWLGALGQEATWDLIAQSDLFVLSSFAEGGARVLSEAAVAGVPIVAARNDATTSLLADDYPGLYDAGDTEALATLLDRAESDAEFLETLTERVRALAPQFSPGRETEIWRRLLAELSSEPAPSSESA